MVEFAILGPVEVRRGGRVVALGGTKPRALLAALLLSPNQPVSAERLAVALWGEDAPAGAVRTVQVYVSRLRRALGDEDVLATTPAGYRLRVRPGELDVDRFERLVDDGRRALAAEQPQEAGELLREALGLWRGPPLADVASEPFARPEIAALEEQRLAAMEARLEADLAAGRHAALIGELRHLIAEQPLRERLHGQLMLALYRSGRQADALESYRHARRMLVAELGIEPGPELRRLEREILEHGPSLRVPPSSRPSVPLPPNATLGRERELAAVSALLQREDTRLLTLTGPGGVGKTRLALELAHALATELADGVYFVALASTARADQVAGAVAHALGVTSPAGEAAAEALARFLVAKELLLVLDSFEHVHGAGPMLAELLATSAGVRVLVTSRRPLRLSAERVFSVPPLGPSEAVALFAERVRAAGHEVRVHEADAAAVTSICARLDRLPLAIELAAARTAVLPPRALLRRLDRRFELLGPGARDADERQRTLWATIDWSYELLDELEQAVFRRLAVFAGGCLVDAADEICATDALLDRLTALVDHSLLRRDTTATGEPRFSMLESIREYAATRLAMSAEREEIQRRHAEYFAALAEKLDPDTRSGRDSAALDLLELEHDNLRAALDWTEAAGCNDLLLRLAGALSWFWYVRGHAHEGLDRLDAALSAGARTDPARAKVLLGRALLRAMLGQLNEAEADGNELLALAEKTGDVRLCALAIDRLALVAQQRGDYAQARAMHEQVAALSRRTGDVRLLGIAFGNLADIALNEGRFEEAVALSADALSIGREAGNLERAATSLVNLASALLELGSADEAAERFAQSLRHSHELGLVESTAYALDGLGAAAAQLGRPAHAAQLLGAAEAALHIAGTTLQAFEARRHEEIVAQLRDELGREALAAAWTEGQGMAPTDAATLVLDDARGAANARSSGA